MFWGFPQRLRLQCWLIENPPPGAQKGGAGRYFPALKAPREPIYWVRTHFASQSWKNSVLTPTRIFLRVFNCLQLIQNLHSSKNYSAFYQKVNILPIFWHTFGDRPPPKRKNSQKDQTRILDSQFKINLIPKRTNNEGGQGSESLDLPRNLFIFLFIFI